MDRKIQGTPSSASKDTPRKKSWELGRGVVVKSQMRGNARFLGPRLFNLFEKIFFGEKNRIYHKIGLKGELGFYSKKGSKLGRELGEGEIWVKRVVLTALRAWLAVVIIDLLRN